MAIKVYACYQTMQMQKASHMQVTNEVEEDIRNEPRWEYSSSGQKTLDLGFGAGASKSARNALTWIKLRAVSISFFPVSIA